MKLSELDLLLVKDYLRQDGDEDDRLITAIIEASKSYICNYKSILITHNLLDCRKKMR